MTFLEAINKRKILAAEIEEMILEFEKETGLTVQSVDVDAVDIETYTNHIASRSVQVNVMVILP